MAISIKITAPVFKSDTIGSFEKKANVEIAADFDNFSEGYVLLRAQVDELLKQSHAENTLLLNLQELKRTISNKEMTLVFLNRNIETAKSQLQRLQNFLERLGIDPGSCSLFIADQPVGSAVVVEAEVDPIPFNQGTDEESHEF